MVEIKWQDPPSRRGGTSRDYDAVIEKQNPGKWALISDQWKTTAPPSAFKQRGCEATARRNEGSKTWSVYARWPHKTTPAVAAPVDAEKAKILQAVQSGSALTPPPALAPRKGSPAANAAGAADMGLSKFLADRRARGAVDIPE
ncbi:hypothetical protein [Pseudarthrobacter sp. ATCC 49987]|uniref:hypothetical protein n=1 Tax=Pseudarthrobacter sp. ATCC 49987 TaxID=2698204 RepID=UPI00136B9692|nr:hypothetical protein [Pseudarthrobacter sp. ATCC 49987]